GGSGKRVRSLGKDDRLSGFLHMRSTSVVLQNLKGCALVSPLVERRRPKHSPDAAGVNRKCQPAGVPPPPRPPKIANGLPGTVSQTISPPGSTCPWTRAASASASSLESVPTIRYRHRRSTE